MYSIRESTRRESPLQIESQEFRRLGYRLIDRIAEHLQELNTLRVSPGETPSRVREVIDGGRSLPQSGSDVGEILERAQRILFDHSLFNGHPRFWGYITASAAPVGILGELLAAAVNANVGAFRLAPAATEIESQTVRWIAELIGFPKSCGGLLTSGGNVANILCFLAVRARMGGTALRETGLSRPGAPVLRIYTSRETHTWVQKAADITGLGTEAVVWIETDEGLRIRTDLLKSRIQQDQREGLTPMMVVGTAGSVSTGAIDPLGELAAICRQEGLWFHVDGAYGAPAAAVPGVSTDLLALREADSVAVDPHKWLYAPLEAGCVLVRDPRTLPAAFSYHPSYYHFDEETTNYFDQGIQNSRGFRALKVWLALQQAGRQGYAKMIAEEIDLSRELFRSLAFYPELEAFTQGLSIATFRFCPSDLRDGRDEPEVSSYLNDLNREILNRIERSGEAFLSNAVIRESFVLRMCIVNFRTTREDVQRLPDLVLEVGRKADLELRRRLSCRI